MIARPNAFGLIGDDPQTCAKRYGKLVSKDSDGSVRYHRYDAESKTTLSALIYFTDGRVTKIRYQLLEGDGSSGDSALLRIDDIKALLKINAGEGKWVLQEEAPGLYESFWRNETMKIRGLLLAGNYSWFLDLISDKHPE